MKKLVVLSFFIFTCKLNFAQYALDWTFNAGGVVVDHINDTTSTASNVVVQPDGKIIAVGNSPAITGNSWVIARYNSNGSVDTGFDSDGKVIISSGGICRTVILQPDNKILVGGSWPAAFGYDFAMTRLLPDGSLDTTFGSAGIATYNQYDFDQIYSLALQPDGKILAGGYTGTKNIFRFNSNGSIDTSFDQEPFALMGGDITAINIYVLPGGKIISVHQYYCCDAPGPDGADGLIIRYNANGSVDASFNHLGYHEYNFGAGYSYFFGSCIQPDGKIVAGGRFINPPSGTTFIPAFTRVDTTGAVDTSFGTSGVQLITGIPDESLIGSISLQADGKIIIAGHSSIGPNTNITLIRLNTDGSPDVSFGTSGVVITDLGVDERIAASCLQPDQKLIVTGSINSGSGPDFLVARYNANASSVSEITNKNTISLYPNPANNLVTISTKKEFANATIKLIDVSGQSILTKQNVNGNSVSVDVSQQPSGLYFIEINNSGTMLRSKLIKQ